MTVHETEHFSAVLLIRIRDPVPFWPLDPWSGMGKTSRSGSVIRNRDEHFGSYFRELRNNFLSLNTSILWCGSFWPGIREEKNSDLGSTDKHPKSAKLLFCRSVLLLSILEMTAFFNMRFSAGDAKKSCDGLLAGLKAHYNLWKNWRRSSLHWRRPISHSMYYLCRAPPH